MHQPSSACFPTTTTTKTSQDPTANQSRYQQHHLLLETNINIPSAMPLDKDHEQQVLMYFTDPNSGARRVQQRRRASLLAIECLVGLRGNENGVGVANSNNVQPDSVVMHQEQRHAAPPSQQQQAQQVHKPNSSTIMEARPVHVPSSALASSQTQTQAQAPVNRNVTTNHHHRTANYRRATEPYRVVSQQRHHHHPYSSSTNHQNQNHHQHQHAQHQQQQSVNTNTHNVRIMGMQQQQQHSANTIVQAQRRSTAPAQLTSTTTILHLLHSTAPSRRNVNVNVNMNVNDNSTTRTCICPSVPAQQLHPLRCAPRTTTKNIHIHNSTDTDGNNNNNNNKRVLVRVSNPHDVILAPGTAYTGYSGNIRFQNMLQRQAHIILSRPGGISSISSNNNNNNNNTQLYDHSSCDPNTHSARDVAKMVVTAVRHQSPPGRFLREDKASGLWYDAGDEDAVSRTVRILRKLLKHNGGPVVGSGGSASASAQHQQVVATEKDEGQLQVQQSKTCAKKKPSQFHDKVLHLLDDAWTHDEEDLNSKLCEFYRGRMDQRSAAMSSNSGVVASSGPVVQTASMHHKMMSHRRHRCPPYASQAMTRNIAGNKRRRDDDHESRSIELERQQQVESSDEQNRVSEPPKNVFKRRMAVRRLSTPAA